MARRHTISRQQNGSLLERAGVLSAFSPLRCERPDGAHASQAFLRERTRLRQLVLRSAGTRSAATRSMFGITFGDSVTRSVATCLVYPARRMRATTIA